MCDAAIPVGAVTATASSPNRAPSSCTRKRSRYDFPTPAGPVTNALAPPSTRWATSRCSGLRADSEIRTEGEEDADADADAEDEDEEEAEAEAEDPEESAGAVPTCPMASCADFPNAAFGW